MYAECSDYFYVWLKRSLRDMWPQFTDLVLTDKVDEAVANPVAVRMSLGLVDAADGRMATVPPPSESPTHATRSSSRGSFLEAHRVLQDDGVLTVMFTHKRVEAWDTLGAALA